MSGYLESPLKRFSWFHLREKCSEYVYRSSYVCLTFCLHLLFFSASQIISKRETLSEQPQVPGHMATPC